MRLCPVSSFLVYCSRTGLLSLAVHVFTLLSKVRQLCDSLACRSDCIVLLFLPGSQRVKSLVKLARLLFGGTLSTVYGLGLRPNGFRVFGFRV